MRRLPLLVALVALLVGLLTFVPQGAGAWTRPPARIAGADRYETALKISTVAFPNGAATAVIASGESFPDGLAAGPLAALYDAPVLLTARDSLPSSTATELGRLAPAQLFVVGGTAAVSAEVLTELQSATGVVPARIAGASRYDTATAVASKFPTPAPVAFVASGTDFADALSGGAAAAIAVAPLLLTLPDALPDAVGDELAHLAPPEALVLGGSGAVSDAVVGAIDQRVAGVRRLAGPDRYATAAAVAADRSPNATQTLLATGTAFPDALAAAALARKLGAPILLTTTCEPASTVDYLRAHGWADVTVVGGTGAVPEFGLSLPCTPVADGEVAPGITLSTELLGGPDVVHVVTIDRSKGLAVRPVMASGRLTGRMTTTEIARGNGVPVAINGTFFLASGEPSYALAISGRLLKAPGGGGTILALNPLKPSEYFFASPDFNITLGDIAVNKVNSGAPGGGEVGLFTTEDGRAVDVGTKYCRAGLVPTDAPTVDDGTGDIVQHTSVHSVACSTNSIVADDTDVVAALADTPEGDGVANLEVGRTIGLRWRVHPAAAGFTDVIGGNLRLVIGNQVASDVTGNSGPFFTEHAPRTAIGALPDGRLVIVTVDGRQPGYSVGWTPRQLADFMVQLGCIDAMNLDGGGSTSLSVGGVLANRPSDPAGQRAVGDVLLVDPIG